jgi:hypothetical protein
MRAGLLAGVLLLLLGSAGASAAPCKAGDTITLEGEIIIPPVMDGGEWFWPGKFAGKPCQVTTLRGKGALPPGCVVGKRMTLMGLVVEDGVLILEVASLRCD